MSGLQQTRTHSWQNFDLTADGIDHYAGSDIPLECAPGPLMADVAASATNPWTDSVIEWGSGPTLFGDRGEIHLEAGKTYVFTDADNGGSFAIEGAKLAADGLEVDIETRRSSKILYYTAK